MKREFPVGRRQFFAAAVAVSAGAMFRAGSASAMPKIDLRERLARRIVAESGFQGGLVVTVGGRDADLAVSLGKAPNVLVHWLVPDGVGLADARRESASLIMNRPSVWRRLQGAEPGLQGVFGAPSINTIIRRAFKTRFASTSPKEATHPLFSKTIQRQRLLVRVRALHQLRRTYPLMFQARPSLWSCLIV